jgi:endonuclease YncB( thermonuclease family)
MTDFRDFTFPVRLLYIDAPEMNTEDGPKSKSWLEDLIMGEEIEVFIDPDNRVGKWGRILGKIMCKGMDINNLSLILGQSQEFESGIKQFT